MLIRIGHDIEWALDSPTTLIAALSVHPSRAQDLPRPEKLVVEPPLAPRPPKMASAVIVTSPVARLWSPFTSRVPATAAVGPV